MRKKKKELALCVCLAICLIAFIASGLHFTDTTMASNASSSQTAVVTLTSSTSNPSGEFTITIAVSTQVASYGITGEITYDNTRFEFVPKAVTGGLASNVYTHGISAVIADFVDITASFSQKEFVLATLAFKVKRGAPAGDGIFAFTALNYFDTLVRAVNVASTDVTVTIEGTDTPTTAAIQVEMDGVDLQRSGEVWSGSVSSQVTQIDTKDIRIYGVPDDAKVEFSPTGIVELEEGVEKYIMVKVISDDKEEVYTITITRKSAEPSDTTGKPDWLDGISEKTWMIILAVIALLILILLVRSFVRHRKKKNFR